MKIEQIYTGCLAEAAYYIESEGEVAIIDPLRETEPYIKKAQNAGHKIKYILETHFHADFVSGHVDLSQKSGAQIIYGPGAKTNYDIYEAKDGETFNLGKVQIRVLHTPGHTLESSTYLLIDENGKNHAIFTGDTLFIGDVGRPDLAQKAGSITQEDLAGMLYDSLQQKIMILEDDVIVYPAHGAGSACGKNMSKETFDTLGNQKQTNYALKAEDKADFIAKVTDGLLPPPQYFAKNAMLNKSGYESLDTVLERGVIPLNPQKFEAVVNQEGAIVLDTRSPQNFVKGFIPNSIFIGIDGSFAPWVGTLITDIKQAMVIIVDEGRAEEVVIRLSRVGYDNTLGYLEGGVEAWKNAGKELDSIESIDAPTLEKIMQENSNTQVIDVRKPSEYDAEHAEKADNVPLDFINEHMGNLQRNEKYYLHCAGGYRSVIMASILKARGFENLVNIEGGFGAMKKTTIPMTDFACQASK